MGYFLFFSGVAPNIREPSVECVSVIILAFGDASTYPAAGSVFSSIMAVDRTTYGSVCACVVADSCGALYLRQTEPPAECGAQVPIIHWRGPFFRDEVCTRFGARPK